MALQTTTEIYVSGTAIHSYVSLKLVQEIDAHHDLELICRTDVVEKLSEELIGDSKDYLGGIITIQISAIKGFDGYKELEFKGVITKVKSTKGYDLSTGDLVTLYAKSTSILADDGSHYASFNDFSLVDILNKTFQEYDKGKLETKFSPVHSDNIHYSVQHNQSAFSYASRLAAYHNEWFYYDGKKLVFGSPSTEETELTYGVDLRDFSLELSSVPNSFDYFTNDYLTDEVHKKSSTEVTIPSEGYHGFANQKSKQLFKKQTQVYHNLYSDTSLKQRLDTQIEHYTKAVAMQQVIVKGSSDNPGVNLGEIIKVKGYGNYRIIKVTHTNIEGGAYKNSFEAVDASFTGYPKMDIHLYPKCETQIATVMENVDPDGMSRIRVQFPWQKPYGELTPWLRVVSPHAGGEKGFHFIPEEGEEVLVGFEGGNAERPYVMGSLYTGTAQPKGFQSGANDIKAIQSRSGNKMVLDDNAGSMFLTDKGTASMMMDGGGNTNVCTDASHTTTVGENSSVLKMDADGNIVIKGNKSLMIEIGNSTFEMKENGHINLNGCIIKVVGSDITELGKEEATTGVKIDSNVTIKGGKVDIN
ncbi:MAG: type VI secretion system Vgr family protein [Polaribacter sp.]